MKQIDFVTWEHCSWLLEHAHHGFRTGQSCLARLWYSHICAEKGR